MTEPAFILVEPQMGENIGAAARAMWNFGLSSMRVVDPRDGWPNPRAVALASGAGRVLDRAAVHGRTADAVADLTYVYATTARPRELTKRVLTPEAAARDAHARAAAGEKVGFMFGRERTGLETGDVTLANAIVTVPVNPEFPSLNLAQCVLLMAYEWHRLGDETPPDTLVINRTEMATRADVARVTGRLIDALDEKGFFFPEAKRPSMEGNLSNLMQRFSLTEQEVRTLHGVIRALTRERAEGGAHPGSGDTSGE